MPPLLSSFGYPTQTTVQWKFFTNSSGHGKKRTLTTQKVSVWITEYMQSPDGNVTSTSWNDITGDEHKKRNYFENKQGCISVFNHSLITTQSMRLNEHSSSKVFGMLQNKHWVSGSVSTFGCHSIHTHHPCTQAMLDFTPHPRPSLRSLVTVDLVKENPDSPLAQITAPFHRKVCVNTCNMPAIFSKALRAFCRKPFMRFSNVPPTTLWRLWRWTCTHLLKWCRSSRDQIALPLLFRSPLRILMICEWVNLILVLLFKPGGSNHHFSVNFSKASVTLSSASRKLSA